MTHQVNETHCRLPAEPDKTASCQEANWSGQRCVIYFDPSECTQTSVLLDIGIGLEQSNNA